MEKVIRILRKHPAGQASIIQILQDVQLEYNYLPKEVLAYIARKLHMPLSKIYGIATFFAAFSLEPRGKHCVTVCVGTACHVRGAPAVLQRLQEKLGIAAGETSKDREYTLETVNCLGACALAPIVVMDGKYHGQVSAQAADKIIKAAK
jgi:NADH-quinone oxidoreductase subunit E